MSRAASVFYYRKFGENRYKNNVLLRATCTCPATGVFKSRPHSAGRLRKNRNFRTFRRFFLKSRPERKCPIKTSNTRVIFVMLPQRYFCNWQLNCNFSHQWSIIIQWVGGIPANNVKQPSGVPIYHCVSVRITESLELLSMVWIVSIITYNSNNTLKSLLLLSLTLSYF